jgi:hypothetical protein
VTDTYCWGACWRPERQGSPLDITTLCLNLRHLASLIAEPENTQWFPQHVWEEANIPEAKNEHRAKTWNGERKKF